jgi:hypothetical protein
MDDGIGENSTNMIQYLGQKLKGCFVAGTKHVLKDTPMPWDPLGIGPARKGWIGSQSGSGMTWHLDFGDHTDSQGIGVTNQGPYLSLGIIATVLLMAIQKGILHVHRAAS